MTTTYNSAQKDRNVNYPFSIIFSRIFSTTVRFLVVITTSF